MEIQFHTESTLALLIAETFLTVVTLSVDTDVRTIYNLISDVNGARAVPFLTSLCADILERYLEYGEEHSLSRMDELF